MRSEQEDAELIARYLQTKDINLREQIVIRYVPLVHYVLGRLGFYQASSVDYDDVVSQGLLGLIEALERYDPGFGTVFSTYATLRIRGYVLDYLRSQDWLPRTARQRARSVQDAVTHLWNELSREPTDEELAKYLNLDMEQLQNALIDSSYVILSLDMITSDSDSGGEDETSLYEVLPDDQQPNPSEVFEDKDQRSRLVDALKKLSEREQLLLSLYYYEELTLKEVGAVLGVSESRVSQLHTRAMMTLRAMLGIEDESITLSDLRTDGAGGEKR
jgi:RNA polymerase sigma factor for flagellar operon FliA